MMPCYKSVKMVLDKLAALILIVALLPLLLILSIMVFIDQKKVLFAQRRPGLLTNVFTLYKFKTMKDGNESDENRVTLFGRFLRRSSLDELPQLINILRGEMSFIGPRPYLEEYLDRYSDFHAKRHWIMPGITGWSQVNGGNGLSWEVKLDMDVYYVEYVSFWMDLKIVSKTLILLMKGNRKDQPETNFFEYKS